MAWLRRLIGGFTALLPPEPIDLKWASGNYFTALRVPAASGRTLLPSDDGRDEDS
jgi:hypothetical protein